MCVGGVKAVTRDASGTKCGSVRADEVTTDKCACDKVNGVSHVREARSELNH